jgi:peroxiredoxin
MEGKTPAGIMGKPKTTCEFCYKIYIAILFLCCINFGCQKEIISVHIGDKAPDFTLPNLEDEYCNLSKYIENSEIIFMVFWADWCSFCKTGMRMMDRVYQNEKKFGFEILAINVKQSKEDVKKVIKKLRVSYPVLLDHTADVTIHKYGVIAIPSFFLIDKSGVLCEKIIGDLSDQQIMDIVSPYLHGKNVEKENRN